jgi:hypothetical protein
MSSELPVFFFAPEAGLSLLMRYPVTVASPFRAATARKRTR